MKKMALIFCLMLALIIGQNFVDQDKSRSSKKSIDQAKRTSHAKELLGKYYSGSAAQSAENVKDLDVAIRETVSKSLPKKYKSKAKALSRMIMKQAKAHNLDPVFVMAMIKTESGFNPLARGQFGEIGLMQLKPDTAKWIAKKEKIPWHGPKTLEDPVQNVRLGIAFVSDLRDRVNHHANKYVSAYNMGLRKVRNLYSADVKPKMYSKRVMANYTELYATLVAGRLPTPEAKSEAQIIVEDIDTSSFGTTATAATTAPATESVQVLDATPSDSKLVETAKPEEATKESAAREPAQAPVEKSGVSEPLKESPAAPSVAQELIEFEVKVREVN
jgi:soluble lytic murein transglycosylase